MRLPRYSARAVSKRLFAGDEIEPDLWEGAVHQVAAHIAVLDTCYKSKLQTAVWATQRIQWLAHSDIAVRVEHIKRRAQQTDSPARFWATKA